MTSGILLGWESACAPSSQIGFVRREIPVDSKKVSAFVTDTSDQHVLVVAPTGTGKSRSLAIPNLLCWDGSAIVLDIKGELSATTAEYRRTVLKQKVIRLDPFKLATQAPHRLNPLDLLRKDGASVPDVAMQLAVMLSTPATVSRDPFWQERAQNLVAGLMAYVATQPALDADTTFRKMWQLMHADDTVHGLAVAMDRDAATMPPFARGVLAAFLQTTDVTRSGICATAENLVRIFGSEEVQKATEETDWDVGALARGEPITVYVCIPATKLLSHAPLVRLWLSLLMGVLNERTVRPSKPTLVMLDEVAQLGPMDPVRTLMTLSRGYGARAMLFVQSLEQLHEAYKDSITLIDNAGTLVTFGHSRRPMSVTMADHLGDVSADQLYRMPKDILAIKRVGEDTQFLRKCDYVTDALLSDRATPNPMFATMTGTVS